VVELKRHEIIQQAILIASVLFDGLYVDDSLGYSYFLSSVI